MVTLPPCFNSLLLIPILLNRALGDASSPKPSDQETTGVLALGIRRNDATIEVALTLESHRAQLERLISRHSGYDGVQITRVEPAKFAQVTGAGDDENVAELFLIDFRATVIFRNEVDDVGLRHSIARALDASGAHLSVEDVSVELNRDPLNSEKHHGGHVLPLAVSAIFATAVVACCVAKRLANRKASSSKGAPDIEAGLEHQVVSSLPSSGCKTNESCFNGKLEMQVEAAADTLDDLPVPPQLCSSLAEAPCEEPIAEYADPCSPTHAPYAEDESSEADLTVNELIEARADAVSVNSSENEEDVQQDEETPKSAEAAVAEVECASQSDASPVHSSLPDGVMSL